MFNAAASLIQKLVYDVNKLNIPVENRQKFFTAINENDLSTLEQMFDEIGRPIYHLASMYSAVMEVLTAYHSPEYVKGMTDCVEAILSLNNNVDPQKIVEEAIDPDIGNMIEDVVERNFSENGEFDHRTIKREIEQNIHHHFKQAFDIDSEFQKLSGHSISDYNLDFSTPADLVRFAMANISPKTFVIFIAAVVCKRGNKFGSLSTCPGKLCHFHLGDGDEQVDFGIENGKFFRIDHSSETRKQTDLNQMYNELVKALEVKFDA